MKKILAISLVVAMLAGLIGAGVVTAQGNGIKASKATAKVSELTLMEWQGVENDNDGDTLVDEDPEDDIDNDEDGFVDEDGPDTPYDSGWTTILTQNIKMPNKKDLLIDVSLETGLYTGTLVRSKRKSADDQEWDTSTAHAQVMVQVLVDGKTASVEPGNEDYGQETGVAFPRLVTFNDRSQTLSAKFMGIFTGECLIVVPVECEEQINNDGDEDAEGNPIYSEDPIDGVDNDGDTLIDEDPVEMCDTIQIDYDCLEPEELELILETLSANSFNFVVADLTPGDHVITVEAKIVADGTAEEGKYEAYALVGQGSVVIEAVRMIKGEDYLDIPE